MSDYNDTNIYSLFFETLGHPSNISRYSFIVNLTPTERLNIINQKPVEQQWIKVLNKWQLQNIQPTAEEKQYISCLNLVYTG